MATDTTIDEVLRIAEEETGREALTLETRLDSIFEDSLDYLDFTLKLGTLGHLPEEAISQAETLGDLANAIVYPN